MIDDKIMERTARTLNTDIANLRAKTQTIYDEQGATWIAQGKSEEDAYALSLKVAGTQIRSENASLARSGAKRLQGMFVSVPRMKEWGKILYNKMKGQLLNASEEVRMQFVDRGDVVLFEANQDGTYTRYAASKFFGSDEDTVTELPRHTMELGNGAFFYSVWDKTNETFANGNRNFKYGQPRPQDDRERSSMFLGRVEGEDGWRLISVSGSNKAADVQWPTFTPGTLAVGVGQNPDRAYLKPAMLDFTADASLANIFDAPPNALLNDEKIPIDMLGGLSDLPAWGEENTGNWDALAGVVAEVIHVDPRDNGASTLVCADLDISSSAPVVEVYSPKDKVIDFGVGSKILLVGSTWKDKMTEEQRMGVSGWWVFDEVTPVEAAIAETTDASIEEW